MPRHGDRGAPSSPSGTPDPTVPAATSDPATSSGSEATDDSAGGRGHHGLPHLGQIAASATQVAASVGHGAAVLGQATEAVRLSVVPTGLTGPRVLVGHVIGMHLALPAGGLHGPRQIPAWVYLFADALAIRPSDDAAMSTLPMFGLHMVLPPVAVARWLYKAGRVEHANLDLVETAQAFEAALPAWTVDDFAEADPKVQVHRLADLAGPVHVYERLGLAHLRVVPPDASSMGPGGAPVGPAEGGAPVGPASSDAPVGLAAGAVSPGASADAGSDSAAGSAASAGASVGAAAGGEAAGTGTGEPEVAAPVHLKSTLPVPADAFAQLWQLCRTVTWPHGLTMEAPHRSADD